MTVYGSTAKAVVSVAYNDPLETDIRLPVVAAGMNAQGKIIGGYHKSVFDPSAIGNTNQFIMNAFRWVTTLPLMNVAIMEHDNPDLINLLNANPTPISSTVVKNSDINTIDVANYQVVFSTDVGCPEATFLRQYIYTGGGVIIAVTPQGYVDGHFGSRWPPNLLSKDFGFVWGNTKSRNFNITRIPVSIEVSNNYLINTNVLDCWSIVQLNYNKDVFLDDSSTPLFQYGYLLLEGLQHVPKTVLGGLTPTFYDDAKDVVIALASSQPPLKPSVNDPIKEPRDKFQLLLFHTLSVNVLEPVHVKAHPGYDIFPGDCKLTLRALERKFNRNASDKSIRQSITIELNRTVGSYYDTKEKVSYLGDEIFWYSTGVYAKPEKVIDITITSDGCYGGFFVQVGSHSTILNSDVDWVRLPALISKTHFDATTKQLSSPYGGLIYIGIPPGNPVEEYWTAFEATITAMPGDVFKATSFINRLSLPDVWLMEIQSNENCWVELEGDYTVITISREEAKTIKSPEKIVIWWDSIIKNMINFRNISQEGYRKCRFVSDLLPDVRFYTEPYPMPINPTQLNYVLNAETVKPNTGYWEFLTNVGSHHLILELIFPGMYLQLPSLFALYIFENMLFIPRNQTHTSFENYDVRYYTAAYIHEPVGFDINFNHYIYDIWLPFYTLMQLQTKFGWVYVTSLFESSNSLRREGKILLDFTLRDRFVSVSSNMVNINLISLFKSWGWPLSPSLDVDLASLTATNVTAEDFYNSIPDDTK